MNCKTSGEQIRCEEMIVATLGRTTQVPCSCLKLTETPATNTLDRYRSNDVRAHLSQRCAPTAHVQIRLRIDAFKHAWFAINGALRVRASRGRILEKERRIHPFVEIAARITFPALVTTTNQSRGRCKLMTDDE